MEQQVQPRHGPRFFVEDLRPGISRLSDCEAGHLRRARRLIAGDRVALFDGQGNEAAGRVMTAARSAVDVAVEHITHHLRPQPSLTLAVALPKGPRQDVLIEKCTELGVAAIWPIITARSISSASQHRLDKWRRASIEAAKQSGQNWLPDFRIPVRLTDLAAELPNFDRMYVSMRDAPRGMNCAGCRGVLAFVGPEGGWAPEELSLLAERGAAPLSLGPNILRIETAAIALAALVHALRPG